MLPDGWGGRHTVCIVCARHQPIKIVATQVNNTGHPSESGYGVKDICRIRDAKRNDLLAFAVYSIRRAEILENRAKGVSEKMLKEVLGAGYGIFAGKTVSWATLLFSPERSRWVASERWHPEQKSRYLDDGGYELKVPCSNDPE